MGGEGKNYFFLGDFDKTQKKIFSLTTWGLGGAGGFFCSCRPRKGSGFIVFVQPFGYVYGGDER